MLLFESSGYLAHRVGQRNGDFDRLMPHIIALAVAICCGIELLRRTKRLRDIRDGRAVFAWMMTIMAIIGWSAIWVLRPPADEAYLRGLSEFAAAHVDVPAIRNWRATRPTTRSSGLIASTDWPAEIAALSPSDVSDVFRGENLLWSSRSGGPRTRGMFIGDDDNCEPPRDPNFITVKVKPGLYVGVQVSR